MSKFARRSINCEKLEKSQFLLKLLNSVCKLKGGRRVPSKNWVFCDCSMAKNWEKLKKMQFFLKLLNSSFKLLHFFRNLENAGIRVIAVQRNAAQEWTQIPWEPAFINHSCMKSAVPAYQ